MKKILAMLLAALMVLSLAACGSTDGETNSSESTTAAASKDEETTTEPAMTTTEMESKTTEAADADPETIKITTLDGNKEEVEIEVPYNPERIAVMDLAALDILDNLGVGDRIVGVSKGSTIDYLQEYVTDDSLVNLGTIKEADLEALMECEPDIIFIGGRLSAYYDELIKIAPVVFLATDTEAGLVKSTSDNAALIASMFGMEDEVADLMADYDARIEALAEIAKDKTAVVGMVTSGGFNVLGNDGRCSIIGVEIGFENVGVDADVDTATHGNDASFEYLASVDPDYIFAMDRDAAIGTEGAQLAAEVLDNEIVAMTQAYQNGNIVILEHPNVWYTAEGGITALGIMLDDLESALLK